MAEQDPVKTSFTAPASPNVRDAKVEEFKEETVIMLFPRAVNLTVGPHDLKKSANSGELEFRGHDIRILRFREGLQAVPVSITEHWYLKAHGVKVYEPTKQDMAKAVNQFSFTPPEVTEHHQKFIASRGYHIRTLEEAKQFVSGIEPAQLPGFFAQAEKWQEPQVSKPELKPADLAAGDAKPPTAPAVPVEQKPLSAMTKAELLAHATEVHGLELDPANKKDELIAAIEAKAKPE